MHTDLAGRPIEVGSYIVYAALLGRSAVLKYGKVVALIEGNDSWRGATPKVQAVTVDASINYKTQEIMGFNVQNKGRPITLSFTERMVVVDQAQIPVSALRALHGA